MFDQSRIQAFWARIDQSAGPSNCWPFSGCTNANGYGRFRIDIGRGVQTETASVVSFAITHGRFPTGVVRHLCHNPPCCNPDHLAEGSLKDNAADSVTARLHAFGERNGRHKLTVEEVGEIRRARQRGDLQKDLARRYGVTRSCISAVDIGRNWSLVETPLPRPAMRRA